MWPGRLSIRMYAIRHGLRPRKEGWRQNESFSPIEEGALNLRMRQKKEGTPAERRGARGLARREHGKCGENSNECQQIHM